MKDFLGRELNIGDTVVYLRPYHRSLAMGRITKINNKQVTIAAGFSDYKVTRDAQICVKVVAND